MDFQQAIDFLNSSPNYEILPRPAHTLVNYDLRRVFDLLARLGNPHLKAKSVHITGSNGKGSTAAMVASALTVSGYRTGLYTSPHLHHWGERVCIDGKPMSEEEIARVVTELHPHIEDINREAKYGKLTTFEMLTAMAFVHYAAKGVEVQVLEVGMGGKFDATSVINPEVAILTPISLEHTDVLGKTLTAITTEKAAIIKPGCTVVTPSQPDEAEQVIEETCRRQGTKRVKVGIDVTWRDMGFDLKGQKLAVKGRLGTYNLSIPLLGKHQLQNASVALAALEVLAEKGFHVSKDSIIRGLAQVRWTGRLHVLSRNPLLIVDGAHNPGATKILREAIGQYFTYKRAILVIGISSDKDLAGIASELAPVFNRVIATRSTNPRAMPPEQIAAEFRKRGVESQTTDSLAEALPLAMSLAGKEDLVCAAGSLFVVAEAIEQAEKQGIAPNATPNGN